MKKPCLVTSSTSALPPAFFAAAEAWRNTRRSHHISTSERPQHAVECRPAHVTLSREYGRLHVRLRACACNSGRWRMAEGARATHLLGDECGQLIGVDGGHVELVLQLVEVTHTDLWRITSDGSTLWLCGMASTPQEHSFCSRARRCLAPVASRLTRNMRGRRRTFPK